MVEITGKGIWAWSFLCGKISDHLFNYFNAYRTNQVFYSFFKVLLNYIFLGICPFWLRFKIIGIKTFKILSKYFYVACSIKCCLVFHSWYYLFVPPTFVLWSVLSVVCQSYFCFQRTNFRLIYWSPVLCLCTSVYIFCIIDFCLYLYYFSCPVLFCSFKKKSWNEHLTH